MKTKHVAYLTETISVRLTADEREAIELRARQQERTVSYIVRRQLRGSLIEQ